MHWEQRIGKFFWCHRAAKFRYKYIALGQNCLLFATTWRSHFQFVLALEEFGSQTLQNHIKLPLVKSIALEEKREKGWKTVQESGIRKVSSSKAENLVPGPFHIWYCFDKCLMFLLSIFDYFYNLEPCLIMQQMNYKWNQCADVSEAIWTSKIIKRLNIDKRQ